MRPPPFPIGSIVKYTGNRSVWDGTGKSLLFTKGMQFTIVELRLPELGLGKIGVDEDDEPIISHNTDGCSVYINCRNEKRLIHAKDRKEWLIINPAT